MIEAPKIIDPLVDPLVGYQKAWIADTSEVAIIEKSRRTGVSWSEACISTLEASSGSGMDVWYIGYNKDRWPTSLFSTAPGGQS